MLRQRVPVLPTPSDAVELSSSSLAWKHLVPVRDLVRSCGYHHRGLLQILELQVVIHVVRGMVRPEAIFDRILDEVEPGNTSVVERNVVRASGVPVPYRYHTEVMEWPQNLLEYRDRLCVTLVPHPSNLAGTVVQVEIRRDLRRQLRMFFDPSSRAVDPFFLATPQSDPDRTPGVQIESLEDAHRFHHHDGAGRVISRAISIMPGIEMGANHHVLVRLVCPTNVAERVVCVQIIREKSVLYVELHSDRHAARHVAVHLVVLLLLHYDVRHGNRHGWIGRGPVSATAYRSVRTSRTSNHTSHAGSSQQ